jgi:hypothetical protein
VGVREIEVGESIIVWLSFCLEKSNTFVAGVRLVVFVWSIAMDKSWKDDLFAGLVGESKCDFFVFVPESQTQFQHLIWPAMACF